MIGIIFYIIGAVLVLFGAAGFMTFVRAFYKVASGYMSNEWVRSETLDIIDGKGVRHILTTVYFFMFMLCLSISIIGGLVCALVVL